MAGTIEGGRKAAKTNKERYGADFYAGIGKKGGQLSRGGGFEGDSVRAKEMGRKGGLVAHLGTGPEDPVKCEMCSLTLRNKRTLNSHRNHQHPYESL